MAEMATSSTLSVSEMRRRDVRGKPAAEAIAAIAGADPHPKEQYLNNRIEHTGASSAASGLCSASSRMDRRNYPLRHRDGSHDAQTTGALSLQSQPSIAEQFAILAAYRPEGHPFLHRRSAFAAQPGEMPCHVCPKLSSIRQYNVSDGAIPFSDG